MASRRQSVSKPQSKKRTASDAKAATKRRAAEDVRHKRAVKKIAAQRQEEELRAQAALAKRMLKTLQRIRDYDSTLASMRQLTYTRIEQVQYVSDSTNGAPYFVPNNTCCPGCETLLTDDEVAHGFYTDRPDDITTRCPHCNLRFVALGSVCANQRQMRHNFTWLCEDQTMAALATWYKAEKHGEEPLVVLQELVKEVPSIVWNLAKYRGANVLESLRVFISVQ